MGKVSCTASESLDPRVARTKQAAFEAAIAIFDEEGWDAITFSAISARSGIGRTTLYRYWDDKASLLQDAIASKAEALISRQIGDLRVDLLSPLERFRDALNDPSSRRLLCAVFVEAENSDEYRQLRRTVTEICTKPVVLALRAGIAAGELRASLDVELTTERLCGTMLFRGLMWHRPVTRTFIESLVDDLLATARP